MRESVTLSPRESDKCALAREKRKSFAACAAKDSRSRALRIGDEQTPPADVDLIDRPPILLCPTRATPE